MPEPTDRLAFAILAGLPVRRFASSAVALFAPGIILRQGMPGRRTARTET
jgi:hypothetical protein